MCGKMDPQYGPNLRAVLYCKHTFLLCVCACISASFLLYSCTFPKLTMLVLL